MSEMRLLFRNSGLYLTAILVLLLSIGMNISKMKCADDGQLYLGIEVPFCSIEKDIDCESKQNKVSCCIIEVEKECCPETKDNSCASETENIQFNFETLLAAFKINFSLAPTLFFNSFLSDNFHLSFNLNSFLSGIPPPKLNKPVLAQIQSFLL